MIQTFLEDYLKQWPKDIKALGIQAQWEECVIPRSSTLIDWGANITIPHTDHVSLVINPNTILEIYNWLEEGTIDNNDHRAPNPNRS